MTFKVIDPGCAFNGGGRVWMTGELDHSKWSRKLDWLLNQQMARAEVHQAPVIAAELRQTMDRWDFEAPALPSVPHGSPLMIGSAELLPTLQTILVPGSADLKQWAVSCHRIWKNLGCPAARIFLPDSSAAEAFRRAWPEDASDCEPQGGLELVEPPPTD